MLLKTSFASALKPRFPVTYTCMSPVSLSVMSRTAFPQSPSLSKFVGVVRTMTATVPSLDTRAPGELCGPRSKGTAGGSTRWILSSPAAWIARASAAILA